MRTPEQVQAALNRVAKWRTLLVGWQLGTRAKGDPEAAAVRDQRELGIILRVEVSALAGLLIRKGVFTQEEWTDQLGEEAEALDAAFAQRFPGVTSSADGLVFDAGMLETIETWMGNWKS